MSYNDLISDISVKVGGGSGCLFPAKDAEYMYVLTAKHILAKADNLSIVAQLISETDYVMKLQVIGEPYFHNNSEIDAAIIKVKTVAIKFDFLSVVKDPCQVIGPLLLAGHPSVRRVDGFSFRADPIKVQNRRPGGYLEGKLEDNATYDEVEGQSGGGVFLQHGGNIFLAGIQSRMAADENEQLGRVVFMPISFFEEILEANSNELSPLHFSIKPYTNDPTANFSFIQVSDLHRVTKECIAEQIISVGAGKYIQEIYTSRQAELKVEQFIEFDTHFTIQANIVLDKLGQVAGNMVHSSAKDAVHKLRETINVVNADLYQTGLGVLKEAFHFDLVKELLEEIDYIILRATEGELDMRISRLIASMYAQPFMVDNPHSMSKPTVIEILVECRRRQKTAGNGKSDTLYKDLIAIFPYFLSINGEEGDKVQLCNYLILELQLLIDEAEKKCIVLVDKAGAGKTNIACHTASQLIPRHPVLLLNGQMAISTEFGIVQHIQAALETRISGVFTDWINRVDKGLKNDKKWFFIIIDGINENGNPGLFANALTDFISRLKFKRIKLILTCRDILWESFTKKLNGFLFRNIIPIDRYSDDEWKMAIGKYFKKYQVTCEPVAGAVQSLRDPLLLRFFCEANEGKSLGSISDIKRAEIFNRYVIRINDSISKSLDFSDEKVVQKYLLGIVGEMWAAKSTNIQYGKVAILKEYSKEFSDKLLQLIVVENIILRREVHQYSTRLTIRFLYDEFMEYMLAGYFFDQICDSSQPQLCIADIIDQSARSLDSFPAVLGAIFFLDQMLEKKELVVSRFIKLAFNGRDTSYQLQFIYALDHIDQKTIDEELISLIENFYDSIDLTYKEQLSKAVLKILPAIPNHRFAKKFLHDVLEVDVLFAELLNSKKELSSFDLVKTPKVEMQFWLPPARFHYSNSMRLNAMAILVQDKDDSNDNFIQLSINRIGLTDIDSALSMMRLLDCLDDERLIKVLDSFSKINLPEYKIFSAWLVRNRYGIEEAALLANLLCDDATRVYEYVFRLFELRQIESQLLEFLLIEYKTASNWHLQNIIQIFGKTVQFRRDDKTITIKKEIVKALNKLLEHKSSNVRLTAFFACQQYPEAFSLNDIKNKMLLDSDSHIRMHGALMLT